MLAKPIGAPCISRFLQHAWGISLAHHIVLARTCCRSSPHALPSSAHTRTGTALHPFCMLQQWQCCACHCLPALMCMICECRPGRRADRGSEAAAGADTSTAASRRLPQRQAPGHAQGGGLHRLPLSAGQDLAAADPPGSTSVSGDTAMETTLPALPACSAGCCEPAMPDR